jgi:DNA-binding SARP family transcriptional activator/Flp pilus assembly protein TadD
MGIVSRDGDFRVLGPLEVVADGRALELGGPRLRAVLALLIADAGRTVGLAALVDGLWGEHAPADADRTVRAYVSRLRKSLQPTAAGEPAEVIVTRPPGYLLRLAPDAVDAARFERLAAGGRQALDAGRPVDAAAQLAAALGLWRGEAYGEFGAAALRAAGARLERLRLAAVADRIDADLASGAGGELIGELEGLTGRHPGHERLWGQLMTALYRAGRQTDALGAFRRARQVLIDESGVEPSPALAEVHRQVLAQDAGLLAARPAAATGGTATPRPAQLPLAVSAFTGRAAALATLDAALAGPAGPSGSDGVVVCAVCGTPGVGKTALAVHWAHRAAAQFPDGQLYVNLRGFDPSRPALAPAEAVRGFLHALGVPAGQVPAGLDAQTALYRSLLAGKRVLVVLDNARDAEQVRPLLPGASGCLAIVTSRDDLVGLVTRDGARRVRLDVLSPDEALDLLGELLAAPPDGPDVDRAAAVTLTRQCARLPLALRIVADLATSRPHTSLAELAAELASEQRRLDLLDAGADRGTAVRAVFSWSERQLPPPAVRLFWLLGLHPGPDADTAAAAALAGIGAGEARRLVATLARAHLIEGTALDRWTMHDLLRVFARERATERIGAADRLAALTRLYDHYLTRAVDAMDTAFPETRHPRQEAAQPAFDSATAARAWLDGERLNLVALSQAASDDPVTGADLAAYAVEIARVVGQYLSVGYHNPDAFAVHRSALAVAEHAGDRGAQALALLELGRTHSRSGHHAEATDHYHRAYSIFEQLGDAAGQARSLHNLGATENRLGEYPAALSHYHTALDLLRAIGDRNGEAGVIASIGQVHWRQGHHRDAVSHLQQAAGLFGADGNPVGQGRILNDLGTILQRQGRYLEAHDCHERALHLLDEVGDRAAAACAHTDLGRIYSIWAQHDRALEQQQHALATFRDIGDPTGEAEVQVEIGDAYERMGRYADAVEAHRRAQALATELGDRRLQSHALAGQGRSLCADGRPAEALAAHRAALAHADETGDREYQARALDGMAVAYDAAGEPEEARQHWSRALDIYAELQLPEADGIRARLATRAPAAQARGAAAARLSS